MKPKKISQYSKSELKSILNGEFTETLRLLKEVCQELLNQRAKS